MNGDLIQTVCMTLVITSLAAVELRVLSFAVTAYVVQALLIVTLLLSYGSINPALYWWAGTAFITKAVLVPAFLSWALSGGQQREPRPLLGFGPSVLLAIVVMLGGFHLIQSHAHVLTLLGQEEVFRMNLAVASTVFILGVFCILTRRDAIKTVIGLCLLENAVHLSLVSLAPELPETALFGVATEVVVTVWLLLYVIKGIRDEFASTDTFKLKVLHG